jgi:hypothetical protein
MYEHDNMEENAACSFQPKSGSHERLTVLNKGPAGDMVYFTKAFFENATDMYL